MSKHLRLGLCTALLAADGCVDDRGSSAEPALSGVADAASPTPTQSSDAGAAPEEGADSAGPDAAGATLTRARLCRPARARDHLPQRTVGTAVRPTMSFEDLRLIVSSTCGTCHLAPLVTGNFTFIDAYEGGDRRINGANLRVPGLREAGAKMAAQLTARKMPPAIIRQSNEAYYLDLGGKLDAWIEAGQPDGTFPLPSSEPSGQRLAPEIAEAMTEIGDCIPDATIVGVDQATDEAFAAAAELPEELGQTDLATLDAYELARKGTLAYNVEYPLWADNAHKGRWVHVPGNYDDPAQPRRQSVTLGEDGKTFQIPDNTRFYKTFFKEVTEADGSKRFRKIETRLILVRKGSGRQPLYGTYLWDENETAARLHAAPYRSGARFKDLVLTYAADEATGQRRTYAVPGRHRCNECHQGSESGDFILGFTPLQINRRESHSLEATPPGADEIAQLERFVAYGVIAGGPEGGGAAPTLPRLEEMGTNRARNDFELQVQAYMHGNCGHCHNPQGFATRQNPALRLNLLAGGIFQLSTSLASVYPQGGLYLRPGNPADSVIFKRVANDTTLSGTIPLLHMPLHTPGTDCGFVNLVGKWITSIPPNAQNATPEQIASAQAAAAAYQSSCKTAPDVSWLEEDFTEPSVYAPRRADWNDPESGMPAEIRALRLGEELRTVAATPIPTGYWVRKAACDFPEVDAPPGGILPWMIRPDGTPKFPYGEVFSQTPGAAYFSAVCQKCHGPRANGESGLAKTLLHATGGRTRVANLIDGLFGNSGQNLALFNLPEPDGSVRNLGGNYLIWMASGGTQAFFPPELTEVVGRNGGNMLNLVRQTCSQLLPDHPNQLIPAYQVYQIYATVCAFGNPITPELGFVPGTTTPIDQVRQDAWLDAAARNAGWMLFQFLKEQASQGQWPLGPNDCEKVYPAAPPS